MVVFQNYSLLPWQTVRQNIALAVNNVMRGSTAAEQSERIEHSIQLVGLGHAADKYPGELSGCCWMNPSAPSMPSPAAICSNS